MSGRSALLACDKGVLGTLPTVSGGRHPKGILLGGVTLRRTHDSSQYVLGHAFQYVPCAWLNVLETITNSLGLCNSLAVDAHPLQRTSLRSCNGGELGPKL